MNRWILVGMMACLTLASSSASRATPQYFPGTGHYYEVIVDQAGFSWSEARVAAEAQVWQGVDGYLACITSEEENLFVYELSRDSGAWYSSGGWEVGPWLGGHQLPGSQEPAGGWTWINGETWIYSNWMPGQPDNNGWNGANEDCLCYWGYEGPPVPTWNDYTDDRPVGPVLGYVVEFDVWTPARETTWGRVKSLFK